MRFDELTMSDGNAEARLRFHPRMTVIGPMPRSEGQDLISAVLAATAGERVGLALTMVDNQGERLISTTDGMFREDGTVASRALGSPAPDTAALRRAMVISGSDLGLPTERYQVGGDTELALKRAELADLRRWQSTIEAGSGADEGSSGDAGLAAELISLDLRLRDADEAQDRRAHHRASVRLADVDAELDVVEGLDRTETDDIALLAVADQLGRLERRRADDRTIYAQAEASLAIAASLVAGRLDAPPQVERLADGAEDEHVLTAPFVAAADAWQRATSHVRTLEIGLSEHTDTDTDDLDWRIPLMAPLDQDELWAAHHRVRQAQRRLQAVAADGRTDLDIPPKLEAAHVERVRTERAAEIRWRPGILASSVLAVLGLALAPSNIVFGILVLLATSAVATMLIIRPRKAAAVAAASERRELAQVGAASYMGLHLRRLADPDDDEAATSLTSLAQEQTASMVAWKELVKHVDPSDADGWETEVRGHALRFNQVLRAEVGQTLEADLQTALLIRDDARAELDRCCSHLERQRDDASADAERADGEEAALVAAIGVEWGPDLAEELGERRIGALRRQRTRDSARDRLEIRAERESLSEEVRHLAQPGWIGAPPRPPSPAAVSLLRRRRDELRSRLESSQAMEYPDLTARLDAVAARVVELEQRCARESSADDEAPANRLLARLAQARKRGDGVVDGLPVVLDDPLSGMDADRRPDLLDLLLRISDRVQIVLVTDDLATVNWARCHVPNGSVLLFEPVRQPVPASVESA